MNKFLLATTVLFATLSGYLYYKLIRPPAPAKICPVSYDYSNGDSVGIINYETAEALANNYKNDSAKAFISTQGKSGVGKFIFEGDAKSVWFSLDRLKNFIWHIENQNCANGCNDTLGLRIYFAKYPDLINTSYEGLADVPKNYSNHHTLFMVPTYKDKDNYDRDFYPGTSCRTPLKSSPTHKGTGIDPNEDIHDPTPYIFLFDLSGATSISNSQNHGGLIPPGSSTGTGFN